VATQDNTKLRNACVTGLESHLITVANAERQLESSFNGTLQVNTELRRALVSFQANRREPVQRWCKYKEGFSLALMRYVFEQLGITSGPVLDPFAGSGTALFAASSSGMDAEGIELLPCAAEIIEVRTLVNSIDRSRAAKAISTFRTKAPWASHGTACQFPHVAITKGAFPRETEYALGTYLSSVNRVRDEQVRRILRFAALCILESVSYTRKDGQYLRWDYRSSRRLSGKKFDKGTILTFDEAISGKLGEIVSDLRGEVTLFDDLQQSHTMGRVTLRTGSCLDILLTLPSYEYTAIITSPPYCNRYDYTRTYALELAMLGAGEAEIRELRQTMLSCTVENRDKIGLETHFSDSVFRRASSAFESQQLLQKIIRYLEVCRSEGFLNNTGIPRMVRNYFFEMALVVFESARVLKPGAPFVMVNDNVRYQGAHIPVDLILSDFARQAGFEIEAIWVLPRGKGNSSQQMGLHGRQEIRKCVYVWRAKGQGAKRQGRKLAREQLRLPRESVARPVTA